MGVLHLPRIPQLGDGLLFAKRDEDRVVTEALAAPSFVCDLALKGPGRADFGPVRSEDDELADVACPAVGDAFELGEQTLDRIGRPARGLDSRAAAESGHLDAGVLAGDPVLGRGMQAPVPCLDPGVLEKGGAVLDRLVGRGEKLDLPPRERTA